MSNLFESFLSGGGSQATDDQNQPKEGAHAPAPGAAAASAAITPRATGPGQQSTAGGSAQTTKSSKAPSKMSPAPQASRSDPSSGARPSSSATATVTSRSQQPTSVGESKSSSSITQHDEKIVDPESLKTFTIPKKKKAKKELYEKISENSSEYTRELLPLITKTYKDPKGSSKIFQYHRPTLIHNGDLLDAYLDRRKEWRLEGYTDKDVSDSYGFLCVEANAEVRKICEEGITTQRGTVANNVLGCSTMGVYLSRHADIIQSNGLAPGFYGKLIVFKFMKGKVKSVMENHGLPALEPTPNYDCHVSKTANVDMSSVSPSGAFEATQVYVYEYGDLGPETRPRQVYPYAVLNFTCSGSSSTHRPAKLKQSKSSKRSQGYSQRPPSASLSRLSMPSNSRPEKPKPKPSPTDAFPSPSPPVRSSSTASIKPKENKPPTSLGQTVDGNGCVVWEGKLLSKGTLMCMVELITYGQAIRPACIGPALNIVSRVPLRLIRTKYLAHVGNLQKNEELSAGNKWYRYSKMQPAGDSVSKFNQVMTYLLKQESAALVKLPDDTEVVVLTNCDITQKLGLSEKRSHPIVLHLIFISHVPRTEMLQNCAKEIVADDQRKTGPTFKEPPKVKRVLQKSASMEKNFEDGFEKLVTADSLLYRPVIVKGFHEEAVLQERVNLERGFGHLNTGASNVPTSVGSSSGHGPRNAPNQQPFLPGQMPNVRVPPPNIYPQGGFSSPGMKPMVSPQRMGMTGHGPNQNQGPGMPFGSPVSGHNFSPGMMMPPPVNVPYQQPQKPMTQPPPNKGGIDPNLANLNFGAPPPPPPPPSISSAPSSAANQTSSSIASNIQGKEMKSSKQMMAELDRKIAEQNAAISALGQGRSGSKARVSSLRNLPLPQVSDSDSDSDEETQKTPAPKYNTGQLEMTDALADIIVRSAPLAARAVREQTTPNRRDPRIHRYASSEPEDRTKENLPSPYKKETAPPPLPKLQENMNVVNKEPTRVIDTANDMKALLDEGLETSSQTVTPEKVEPRDPRIFDEMDDPPSPVLKGLRKKQEVKQALDHGSQGSPQRPPVLLTPPSRPSPQPARRDLAAPEDLGSPKIHSPVTSSPSIPSTTSSCIAAYASEATSVSKSSALPLTTSTLVAPISSTSVSPPVSVSPAITVPPTVSLDKQVPLLLSVSAPKQVKVSPVVLAPKPVSISLSLSAPKQVVSSAISVAKPDPVAPLVSVPKPLPVAAAVSVPQPGPVSTPVSVPLRVSSASQPPPPVSMSQPTTITPTTQTQKDPASSPVTPKSNVSPIPALKSAVPAPMPQTPPNRVLIPVLVAGNVHRPAPIPPPVSQPDPTVKPRSPARVESSPSLQPIGRIVGSEKTETVPSFHQGPMGGQTSDKSPTLGRDPRITAGHLEDPRAGSSDCDKGRPSPVAKTKPSVAANSRPSPIAKVKEPSPVTSEGFSRIEVICELSKNAPPTPPPQPPVGGVTSNLIYIQTEDFSQDSSSDDNTNSRLHSLSELAEPLDLEVFASVTGSEQDHKTTPSPRSESMVLPPIPKLSPLKIGGIGINLKQTALGKVFTGPTRTIPTSRPAQRPNAGGAIRSPNRTSRRRPLRFALGKSSTHTSKQTLSKDADGMKQDEVVAGTDFGAKRVPEPITEDTDFDMGEAEEPEAGKQVSAVTGSKGVKLPPIQGPSSMSASQDKSGSKPQDSDNHVNIRDDSMAPKPVDNNEHSVCTKKMPEAASLPPTETTNTPNLEQRPKGLSSNWLRKLSNIRKNMIDGQQDKMDQYMPPPSDKTGGSDMVMVPLKNIQGPLFLPDAKIVLGEEPQDVSVTFSQEPIPTDCPLPALSNDVWLEACCHAALHNPVCDEDEEMEEKEQTMMFVWFYGLHLMPHDLARYKNKENKPPGPGLSKVKTECKSSSSDPLGVVSNFCKDFKSHLPSCPNFDKADSVKQPKAFKDKLSFVPLDPITPQPPSPADSCPNTQEQINLKESIRITDENMHQHVKKTKKAPQKTSMPLGDTSNSANNVPERLPVSIRKLGVDNRPERTNSPAYRSELILRSPPLKTGDQSIKKVSLDHKSPMLQSKFENFPSKSETNCDTPATMEESETSTGKSYVEKAFLDNAPKENQQGEKACADNASKASQNRENAYVDNAPKESQHGGKACVDNTPKASQHREKACIDNALKVSQHGKKVCVDNPTKASQRGGKVCVDNTPKASQHREKACLDNALKVSQHGKKVCVDNAPKASQQGGKACVDDASNESQHGGNPCVNNASKESQHGEKPCVNNASKESQHEGKACADNAPKASLHREKACEVNIPKASPQGEKTCVDNAPKESQRGEKACVHDALKVSQKGGKPYADSAPKACQHTEKASLDNAPKANQHGEKVCVDNAPKANQQGEKACVDIAPKESQHGERACVDNALKVSQHGEKSYVNNALRVSHQPEKACVDNAPKESQHGEEICLDNVPKTSQHGEKACVVNAPKLSQHCEKKPSIHDICKESHAGEKPSINNVSKDSQEEYAEEEEDAQELLHKKISFIIDVTLETDTLKTHESSVESRLTSTEKDFGKASTAITVGSVPNHVHDSSESVGIITSKDLASKDSEARPLDNSTKCHDGSSAPERKHQEDSQETSKNKKRKLETDDSKHASKYKKIEDRKDKLISLDKSDKSKSSYKSKSSDRSKSSDKAKDHIIKSSEAIKPKTQNKDRASIHKVLKVIDITMPIDNTMERSTSVKPSGSSSVRTSSKPESGKQKTTENTLFLQVLKKYKHSKKRWYDKSRYRKFLQPKVVLDATVVEKYLKDQKQRLKVTKVEKTDKLKKLELLKKSIREREREEERHKRKRTTSERSDASIASCDSERKLSKHREEHRHRKRSKPRDDEKDMKHAQHKEKDKRRETKYRENERGHRYSKHKEKELDKTSKLRETHSDSKERDGKGTVEHESKAKKAHTVSKESKLSSVPSKRTTSWRTLISAPEKGSNTVCREPDKKKQTSQDILESVYKPYLPIGTTMMKIPKKAKPSAEDRPNMPSRRSRLATIPLLSTLCKRALGMEEESEPDESPNKSNSGNQSHSSQPQQAGPASTQDIVNSVQRLSSYLANLSKSVPDAAAGPQSVKAGVVMEGLDGRTTAQVAAGRATLNQLGGAIISGARTSSEASNRPGRYHPYQRPRLRSPPRMIDLKAYSFHMDPSSVHMCLSTQSFRLRRQISSLRGDNPAPEPKFRGFHFRRSTWGENDPDKDMRANSLRDPNEVDCTYSQADIADYEDRRSKCSTLESMMHQGQNPASASYGGSGYGTGRDSERTGKEASEETPSINASDSTSRTKNADDDTLAAAASNGPSGKKKKKKYKWPGLNKYQVQVGHTQQVYLPNLKQSLKLQLLDSVIIDKADPRQSKDLPSTSIYMTLRNCDPIASTEYKSLVTIIANAAEKSAEDALSGAILTLTISVENDLIGTLVEVSEDNQQEDDLATNEIQESNIREKVDTITRNDAKIENTMHTQKIPTVHSTELGENNNFEKTKVHNWIQSSQKYFGDSSHEDDSDTQEQQRVSKGNKNRKLSPSRKHLPKGKRSKYDKESHKRPSRSKESTSKLEENKDQSCDQKPQRVGKLSNTTQVAANNQDTVEAVFSALHKTQDETVKTLTEEIDVFGSSLPPWRRKKLQPTTQESVDSSNASDFTDAKNHGDNQESKHYSDDYKEKSHRRKHRNRLVNQKSVDTRLHQDGHIERDHDRRRSQGHREKLNGVYDDSLELDNCMNRENANRDVDMDSQGDLSALSDLSVEEDFSHFGGLSLGTQLECTFKPESVMVKRTQYNALKDWLSKKPLDSYLLGTYDISGLKVEDIKSSRKVDKTVNDCLLQFNNNMAGILGDSFTEHKPLKIDTEKTMGSLFHSIDQYMNQAVSDSTHDDKRHKADTDSYSAPTNDTLPGLTPDHETYTPERATSPVSAFSSNFENAEADSLSADHRHGKQKRGHSEKKSPERKWKQYYCDYPSTDEEDVFEPPRNKRKLSPEPDVCHPETLQLSRKKVPVEDSPETRSDLDIAHMEEDVYREMEALPQYVDPLEDDPIPPNRHSRDRERSHRHHSTNRALENSFDQLPRPEQYQIETVTQNQFNREPSPGFDQSRQHNFDSNFTGYEEKLSSSQSRYEEWEGAHHHHSPPRHRHHEEYWHHSPKYDNHHLRVWEREMLGVHGVKMDHALHDPKVVYHEEPSQFSPHYHRGSPGHMFERFDECGRDSLEREFQRRDERRRDIMDREFPKHDDRQRDSLEREFLRHDDKRRDSLEREFLRHDDRRRDSQEREFLRRDHRRRDSPEREFPRHDDRRRDSRDRDFLRHDDRRRDSREREFLRHDNRQRDSLDREFIRHDNRQRDSLDREFLRHDDRQRGSREREFPGHDDRRRDSREREFLRHDDRRRNSQKREFLRHDDRRRDSQERDFLRHDDRRRDSQEREFLRHDDRRRDSREREFLRHDDRPRDRPEREFLRHDDGRRDSLEREFLRHGDRRRDSPTQDFPRPDDRDYHKKKRDFPRNNMGYEYQEKDHMEKDEYYKNAVDHKSEYDTEGYHHTRDTDQFDYHHRRDSHKERKNSLDRVREHQSKEHRTSSERSKETRNSLERSKEKRNSLERSKEKRNSLERSKVHGNNIDSRKENRISLDRPIEHKNDLEREREHRQRRGSERPHKHLDNEESEEVKRSSQDEKKLPFKQRHTGSQEKLSEKRPVRSSSPTHRKMKKRKPSSPLFPSSELPTRSRKIPKIKPVPGTPAASELVRPNPRADPTYSDSFSSLLMDPYGRTPRPNFDPNFDITKSPRELETRPSDVWWSVMQYFIKEARTNGDLSYLDRPIKDWLKSFGSDILPENSFLAALSLATGKPRQKPTLDRKIATDDAIEFADTSTHMNEYGSASGGKETHQTPAKSAESIPVPSTSTNLTSPIKETQSSEEATAGKTATKKFGKRVNTLALAFKQAVEAKKQAAGQKGVIKSPLIVRKIKPTKSRVQITMPKNIQKVTPVKTPDVVASKDVKAIPYGEEDPDNIEGALNPRIKVPLNTYFEPDLNARVHSTVEDSMESFIRDVTNTITYHLGEQSWNEVSLSQAFHNPPNQVRHLMGLSNLSNELYKTISASFKPRCSTSKFNSEVQTDCSKIPPKNIMPHENQTAMVKCINKSKENHPVQSNKKAAAQIVGSNSPTVVQSSSVKSEVIVQSFPSLSSTTIAPLRIHSNSMEMTVSPDIVQSNNGEKNPGRSTLKELPVVPATSQSTLNMQSTAASDQGLVVSVQVKTEVSSNLQLPQTRIPSCSNETKPTVAALEVRGTVVSSNSEEQSSYHQVKSIPTIISSTNPSGLDSIPLPPQDRSIKIEVGEARKASDACPIPTVTAEWRNQMEPPPPISTLTEWPPKPMSVNVIPTATSSAWGAPPQPQPNWAAPARPHTGPQQQPYGPDWNGGQRPQNWQAGWGGQGAPAPQWQSDQWQMWGPGPRPQCRPPPEAQRGPWNHQQLPPKGYRPRPQHHPHQVNGPKYIRPLMEDWPTENDKPSIQPAEPTTSATISTSIPSARSSRILVFNTDRSTCRNVQMWLLVNGAKLFDPYNIIALKAISLVDTMVLVHKEDLPRLHEVPNLLALKTQEWVKFVTFEGVKDMEDKTYSTILKCGGLAVPDDNILFSLQPESLETICQYMQNETEEGEPWQLIVHHYIFKKLQDASFTSDDFRLEKICTLLRQYEDEGVVRVLHSPEYDYIPVPSHEYLSLMLRLQGENIRRARHTVLLTDLPQSDGKALPFINRGINVMNSSSFMRVIVGMSSSAVVHYNAPNYGKKAEKVFEDAHESSAEDRLPPGIVTNLMVSEPRK